jgi:hypothetical protein
MIIQNVKLPRAIVLVTGKKSIAAIEGMEHATCKNFSIVKAEIHYSSNFMGRFRLSYTMLKNIWFPHESSGDANG